MGMKKRYLQSSALLLSVFLSLAASAQGIYGDVNGDGEVDIADVNEVINVILDRATTPDDSVTLTATLFDTDVSAGQYYRIPAIVPLADGRLLAIADDRHTSNNDIGGNSGIDIVSKLSDDGGRTWGAIQMIADGNPRRQGFENSHGDAAAIADRETGKLLIICASGKQGFGASTLTNPLRVGRYTSDDGGATWNGQEVTNDIYGIFDGYPEVNALFFSSGRICQSSRIKQGEYYRIYSAICGPAGVGSLVLYSDDFGDTWHALGGPAARPTVTPFGDEAKIEALPDGNVLLSCRSKQTATSGRLFNIYDYNTDSWGEMAVSNDPESGTYSENCSCNGELLIVPVIRTSDQRQMYLVLQSVPLGPGRQRVSIYYKPLLESCDYDEPSDFSWGWQCYQVTENYSAYSTMIDLQDGNIAFLLEDCNDNTDSNNSYDIVYKKLPITTITGGRYVSSKQ